MTRQLSDERMKKLIIDRCLATLLLDCSNF